MAYHNSHTLNQINIKKAELKHIKNVYDDTIFNKKLEVRQMVLDYLDEQSEIYNKTIAPLQLELIDLQEARYKEVYADAGGLPQRLQDELQAARKRYRALL